MIFRQYQKRTINKMISALKEHGNSLAIAPTGAGKCLGRGTPVLLYNGTIKPVEHIEVGELLIGPDSLPRHVVSLAHGEEELFRVRPTKGSPYVINRSHILSLVITGNNRVSGHTPGSIVNLSVDEYFGQNKHFKHCAKGWRAAVDFEPQSTESLITPYILGVWLGDGSNTHSNAFANPDPEVISEIKQFASSIGMSVRHELVDTKCPMHFITNGVKNPKSNPFRTELRRLGLPGNKHIPLIFKANSRQIRLEILAGLIDTDGNLSNGTYDFISKDLPLAEDVAYVARSIGLAAYVKRSMKKSQTMDEAREYWRVCISGDISVIPCRVARKKASARKQIKDVLRTGIELESIGIGEYFGFELDGPDRLFLLGDFTVTHNTIMLSGVAGNIQPAKTLILQHRDELVAQNLSKFRKVNPQISVGMFTADHKSWNGSVTFGMAQTLCRQKNLDTIPSLDLLIVDEAHHCAAESYKNIIGKIRDKNPRCMIAGFTATPNRGDKKGLRSIFSNCADQITIKELINLGFLVPPIAYVIEINGVEEGLSKVRKTRDDYDMAEVEAVMNLKVINEEVVERWREKAGDRKTIVFCSTIKHAEDVTKAFRESGVSADMVTGETPSGVRAAILRRFDRGDLQVLVNIAVLTEGFDSPPASCIILLRPCSYKSTMIQMIGRGLRTVNPEEYPGVVKKDCIVLDFGTSLKTHGDIHTSVDLDGNDGKESGDAPEKKCPECEADLPLGVRECPLCGYIFESIKDEDVTIEDVTLTEMDVINNSPFRWVDLFGSEKIMIASGFNAFAGVFSVDGENWHAMGKVKESKILRRLLVGDKIRAISAADDFLRENESDNAAHKSKSWLKLPPTEKQIAALARVGYQNIQFDFSITRYSAAAHLSFQWNRDLIERALFHGN